MWVTPYTGILTLAKLKYFMSKDLSNKTLSHVDIQSLEQEILSAKVKIDILVQSFD